MTALARPAQSLSVAGLGVRVDPRALRGFTSLLGLLVSFALCLVELIALVDVLVLLGVIVRPVRGVGHGAMAPLLRAVDTQGGRDA